MATADATRLSRYSAASGRAVLTDNLFIFRAEGVTFSAAGKLLQSMPHVHREAGMKSIAVAVLAALVSSSGTVERSPRPELMVVQVRSADSTQQPRIRITMRGHLFSSLGIDVRETPSGSIALSSDSGVARGVVTAELSEDTGELIFSTGASNPELVLRMWPKSGAALPRFYAHGHTVLVMRSSSKGLIVNGKP